MIIREASITYKNIVKIETEQVDSPEKAKAYVEKFIQFKDDYDPEVEHFFVIALDRKNKPKGIRIVTNGTATASLVHPREVFRFAVMESATAIICAHNHPSGDPAPSQADIQVTRQLREAAKVLGIDLLDHVILGEKESDIMELGYYSFSNAGMV